MTTVRSVGGAMWLVPWTTSAAGKSAVSGAASPPRLQGESCRQQQPLHVRGDVARLGPAAHDVRLEVDVVSPVEGGQQRLDEPTDAGAGAGERRGIDGDPHDLRRYRLHLAGLPGAPKVAG